MLRSGDCAQQKPEKRESRHGASNSPHLTCNRTSWLDEWMACVSAHEFAQKRSLDPAREPTFLQIRTISSNFGWE